MAQIDIKVPDIGDFKDVAVIERLKPRMATSGALMMGEK